MSTKHTGKAENMRSGGPDESSVKRQNAPLRDLVENGHDLNHSFKNPAASIALDVKAAGTNHSYLHPHSGGPFPSGAMEKANAIKPMVQMGTGKK